MDGSAIKDNDNGRIYLCNNTMGLCMLLNSLADNKFEEDIKEVLLYNFKFKDEIFELCDKSLQSDDVDCMRVALHNIKKIIAGGM